MTNRLLRERGFTLPELMAVVAIVLLILSILIPNVVRARHNANEFMAVKGLRALADALEMYKNDQSDYPDAITAILNAYPPYISKPSIVNATTSSGRPYVGYYFDYTKSSPQRYNYFACPFV